MTVDDDEIFTRQQHAAARILIAQLGCLADGQEFEPAILGASWLPDQPLLRLDDGTLLSAQDLLHAAMTLVWSLLAVEAGRYGEHTPQKAVARLGLGLASLVEPST